MAENENTPEIDPTATPDVSVTEEQQPDQALNNANTADAREQDLARQASDNKSWLYHNINPLLGVLIVVLSFTFFTVVLTFNYEQNPAKKDVVIYLLGAVTSIITMVVGYFFGSSKGSSDKNTTIHTQMRRQP